MISGSIFKSYLGFAALQDLTPSCHLGSSVLYLSEHLFQLQCSFLSSLCIDHLESSLLLELLFLNLTHSNKYSVPASTSVCISCILSLIYFSRVLHIYKHLFFLTFLLSTKDLYILDITFKIMFFLSVLFVFVCAHVICVDVYILQHTCGIHRSSCAVSSSTCRPSQLNSDSQLGGKHLYPHMGLLGILLEV
jgi:hypothetical protein